METPDLPDLDTWEPQYFDPSAMWERIARIWRRKMILEDMTIRHRIKRMLPVIYDESRSTKSRSS